MEGGGLGEGVEEGREGVRIADGQRLIWSRTRELIELITVVGDG